MFYTAIYKDSSKNIIDIQFVHVCIIEETGYVLSFFNETAKINKQQDTCSDCWLTLKLTIWNLYFAADIKNSSNEEMLAGII